MNCNRPAYYTVNILPCMYVNDVNYCKILGKCPLCGCLNVTCNFSLFTREINCIHLYGSCYTDSLKFGRWVLAWLTATLHVLYRILLKISPLPTLTFKFLHRYFTSFISPRPYTAKLHRHEHLAMDKNAVICSLNSLSSSLISSFQYYIPWPKHGNKLKKFSG